MTEYKIVDHPDEPYPTLMHGERKVGWAPGGNISDDDILPELNRLARENEELREELDAANKALEDAQDARRIAFAFRRLDLRRAPLQMNGTDSQFRDNVNGGWRRFRIGDIDDATRAALDAAIRRIEEDEEKDFEEPDMGYDYIR